MHMYIPSKGEYIKIAWIVLSKPQYKIHNQWGLNGLQTPKNNMLWCHYIILQTCHWSTWSIIKLITTSRTRSRTRIRTSNQPAHSSIFFDLYQLPLMSEPWFLWKDSTKTLVQWQITWDAMEWRSSLFFTLHLQKN